MSSQSKLPFLILHFQTIVSTSLPTIASQFGALQSQYTWVGVAYMLTQTAFQPLYGRISDLVGRKMVLYSSMSIFAIGSLLCGAAQSIEWLIAARALAGVGGGGIVSSVWVITAEIVEIQNRAKWSQALSLPGVALQLPVHFLVVYSVVTNFTVIDVTICANVIFLGDHNSSILSWRWGFYINLPICLVAFVVLVCSLHNVTLVQSHDASWKMLLERFDFGGLVLFMGGSSCIVIGFSFASEVGWTAVSTLVLIITGFCRECLFPATTFKNVTTVAILVITFLHNFTFNAGTFYLALYYQAANGSSPLHAGIKMLPYSLGSSLASMPAAWFMGYWQARTRNTSGQNLTISIGLLISTLGFGLLNLLNETSRISSQIIFPLIAGIGLGMLFHAPYQVFAKALKPQELATGTSAFFLVRFTGATVGLAVAGAIFYGQALGNMPTDVPSNIIGSSIDYEALRSLEPISLRVEVLKVISSAIQTVWTVCSPFLGIAFLVSSCIHPGIL
ncbi:major facilitator superfamily domain-containing protein [Cyathus striatus]|nr:major facilitator superfamily domain-containing protein [Cyathus striatus]